MKNMKALALIFLGLVSPVLALPVMDAQYTLSNENIRLTFDDNLALVQIADGNGIGRLSEATALWELQFLLPGSADVTTVKASSATRGHVFAPRGDAPARGPAAHQTMTQSSSKRIAAPR